MSKMFSKDVLMESKFPCVIEEVMPGSGSIDFRNIIRQCENLGKNTTVFIEHLQSFEEYKVSAEFIRRTAEMEKIEII